MNYPLMEEYMMNEKENTGSLLNLLVLEDSVQDFEIIHEQMISAGYNLNMSRVEKESEFAALLRSNKYDIILADFNLPGFDAFGALWLCNEICPDVPFICVSGAIGETIAIELLKQGAVDYVMKDNLDRLPFAVDRALNEAKVKEERRQAEEELNKKLDELLRFHNLTVDRELAMIELKKEVNELLKKSGQEEKYRIVG